ncbi:uncharacterized protein Fot_55773 [Forsythia ovata]|uniref:Knl1 C-terminal RWD domain-containing protein n=1 Tax=Forsythia ovata TaxID=205694 RepID=A0ABD1P342_9LAMI
MDLTTGEAKNHLMNENSEGGGDGGTTMALQKKRSRRVSFAEMTSVHFFDRDDEYNETPRTDTAKPGDNLGNDLGFDRHLEDSKDSEGGDDDDNDDEMVMQSSFLRPMESPSPGSTIGSATSNDEDNFFGPVSASFIRPGRLSDSAASDDNHDVTMDSTAFSMHFRSLARSESGVDLKTPTGVHLSFEEKTPANANVGSSMKLTLVKKPISESSIPATNVSGSHDSNDMSLVGENPNKYNYEKLSPGLDALLAESRKNLLAVVASDDINASQSPGRMKSRLSVSPYDGDSLMDLSEFAKQERGAIISHNLLSKEVSDVHSKFQEANGGTGTSPICHLPQGFSFNPSNAAVSDISDDNQNRPLNQLSKDNFVEESVKDTHEMRRLDASIVNTGDGLSEPNNKHSQSNQDSYNEYGSPVVGSTSLPAKRRQTSPSNSSPSKHLRLGTPFQKRHSFLSSENIKRLESELSIQKSISKLELLEKSSFSSSFSPEIDKSYFKSLDFSKSPPFDTSKEKKLEDFQIEHIEDSVNGEKLSSMKERKRTFSILGNRFESQNHNFGENHLEESSAHTKIGKYSNDMRATILHADQLMKYGGNAASPSQFSESGKKKVHDFITSKHTSDNALITSRTESSLAKITSDKGAKAIVTDGYVTSLGKRLEKDVELQNQIAQLPDFDPVRDSSLKGSVIDANLSTPTADIGSLSVERIEELSSPIIEVRGFQNLFEVKARGDREVDLHTKKEVYETTDNYITPIKHENPQIMHSAILDGGLQAGKDISTFEDNLPARELIDVSRGSFSPSAGRNSNESRFQNLVESLAQSPSRKEIHNKHSSIVLSPKSNQLNDRWQDFSAHKRKNIELHNEITAMQRSPELQKGGYCDPRTLEYPNDGSRGAITIGHEWKQWATVLQIYSKSSEDIKQLISQLTKELNSKAMDVLEDILLHLQRSKTYELLRNEILPQETSNLHNLKHERLGETRLLLHRIVLEKAKLQLKNVKRDRLLKNLHILSSRIQESQMLKMNSLSRLLKTRAAYIEADAVSRQSFSVDSENGDEGVYDKLPKMRQALKDLEREITDLNKKFHASCKMKGEPSCGDTIALVNERLMKRACCRFIRLYMQIWVVHNVESKNGLKNVVLNYLDFAVQSLKVTVGPASTIAISFKFNDANIIKNFPNMDACCAFSFLFDADVRRKYVGVRTLVTETQVTSSLLGTLLDVLEEVQLAQLELPNLTQSSFYCPSVEQLHLQLCFIKFISVRKVTLTLDLSCLKRGIYPSEALPSHLAAPVDGPQSSLSKPALAEIRDSVKRLSAGYMRIFRLCKCVSEVLQASSA